MQLKASDYRIEGECYIWLGSLQDKKHPRLKRSGREMRVCRELLEATQKKPFPRSFVEHSCGEPRCVRLEHLRWQRPLLERYTVVGDCWVWQGGTNGFGYGIVVEKGKQYRVHRLALASRAAPPHPKAMALHSCDNPPCINPSHLRWGSQRENNADCALRKRNYRFRPKLGEQNSRARLKEWQVIEMWNLACTGRFSQAEIGAKFGAPQAMVQKVLAGKAWNHVTACLPGKPQKKASGWRTSMAPGKNHPVKLDKKKADAIRALRLHGHTQNSLAEAFGVSRAAVASVISGKTWKSKSVS